MAAVPSKHLVIIFYFELIDLGSDLLCHTRCLSFAGYFKHLRFPSRAAELQPPTTTRTTILNLKCLANHNSTSKARQSHPLGMPRSILLNHQSQNHQEPKQWCQYFDCRLFRTRLSCKLLWFARTPTETSDASVYSISNVPFLWHFAKLFDIFSLQSFTSRIDLGST